MKTDKKNDILLIEDYIDGNLSKEKTQDFEKRLKYDPEFKKLYHFRLKIRKDLENAKQYKATQNEVANTIHFAKVRRKRNLIYAVAASLALMIMVAGALTLDFGGEQQKMAETEIDSLENKTYQPQINQPKRYADSGKYMPDVFILEHKITTDSITFSWKPETKATTEIIVKTIDDRKELFSHKIEPKTNKITTNKSHFLNDSAVWYLKGINIKDTIIFR